MTTDETPVEDLGDQGGGSAAGSSPSPGQGRKRKPTKYLPTPRVSFEKQVNLLRAFGVLYNSTERQVTNEEAGPTASLAPSTAQLTNAFFVESGFLQRTESGAFVPDSNVREFAQAYEWNPETAGLKLAPKMAGTWFAQALTPRLKISSRPQAEALQVIAEACGASADYADQINFLLSYLELAGLVTIADGVVSAAPNKGAGLPSPPPPSAGSEHGKAEHAETGDSGERKPRERMSPPGQVIEITISIPDKQDGQLHLPDDFDKDDYHMLRVQLDAYMRRKFGWKEED